MKKFWLHFVVGLLVVAGARIALAADAPMTASPGSKPAASTDVVGWDSMATILARIKAPQFPAKDFAITDYGAKSDGAMDCTDAIRQAIEACNKAGGGRVTVPNGVFLTGAIHLLSNVNLHLADAATLKFIVDTAKYLPVVHTRYEGTELMNYSPFIYAYEQENIAITGKGTLDGSGSASTWWGWTSRMAAGVTQLIKDGDMGMPVEQRTFGDGFYLRPNFIQPYRCKNVLIEGVTINNSPMWEINPELCTNVTVRGVNIFSHGPNNDGCDPESCRDVLIENCTFDTGDDCIAIKSGKNDDGRRVGVAAENIIVRGCTMKDGHGGVVIGSEISGDCRNVFVENCRMDSPNLQRALRFKSNLLRGGVIENVFMRNVTIGSVSNAVVTIDLSYERNPAGTHPPILRNVSLENVTSTNSKRLVEQTAIPAGSVVENIRFKDCTFRGLTTNETAVNNGPFTFDHVILVPAGATPAPSAPTAPPP